MNWPPAIAVLLCLCTFSTLAANISGIVKVDTKLAVKPALPAVYDLRGMSIPDAPKQSPDMGGIGRVALWLEAAGLPTASPVSAKMEQHERRFEPDMVIVPLGSTVAFPNLDPVFHNIFSLSRSRSFDLGFYAQGKTRDVVFSRPGIVQVYCHVHPEMYGVVIVTPNAWSARPDRDGAFALQDVPAGKYRLQIWQRSAGLIHKSVTVRDGESIRLTISLPEETSDR
jgi:plastocyanin